VGISKEQEEGFRKMEEFLRGFGMSFIFILWFIWFIFRGKFYWMGLLTRYEKNRNNRNP